MVFLIRNNPQYHSTQLSVVDRQIVQLPVQVAQHRGLDCLGTRPNRIAPQQCRHSAQHKPTKRPETERSARANTSGLHHRGKIVKVTPLMLKHLVQPGNNILEQQRADQRLSTVYLHSTVLTGMIYS